MTTAPPRRSLLLLLTQLLLLRPLLAAATPSITTKAVPRLPGFSGPLPFSLETGYVELDDGVRLFYYFIQSERDPEEDPVLLWLTGGPGCSALSGLVYEIGPFYFDFEGYTGSGLPTLLYKPASWTQVSNVIFVDSPARTGFSYDTTWNRTIPSDTIVIQQLHTFLQTWFDEHPQFLPNPFYVAGDSYSGVIIPPLAMKIAKGIEYGGERLINLKGVIAGNPLTDLMLDFNSRVPFLHRMGIIPDELYEAAREGCRGQYRSPSNADCDNSLQAIDAITRDLNGVHILEKNCTEYPSLAIQKRPRLQDHGSKRLLESAVWSICRKSTYFLSVVWTNDKTVRESLGIHKGTVPSWRRCDFDIPYTKEITYAVDDHLALITKGYRAMIYSGDHDAKIPHVGTQAWIRKLNLPITDNWRPWYVDGQVVGFQKLPACTPPAPKIRRPPDPRRCRPKNPCPSAFPLLFDDPRSALPSPAVPNSRRRSWKAPTGAARGALPGRRRRVHELLRGVFHGEPAVAALPLPHPTGNERVAYQAARTLSNLWILSSIGG